MLIQTKIKNPLKGWQVNRDEINYLGKDLQRPECIITEKDGTVWSADARGGLMKLNVDETQELQVGYVIPDFESTLISERTLVDHHTGIRNLQSEMEKDNARYITAHGSLPNGVCIDSNGDFIIANWGTNHIERMTRDGRMTTLITEIDGVPLGKTNFPLRDSKGRIWFTVTTRTEP